MGVESAVFQSVRKNAQPALGDPTQAQQSGLRGERTSNKVSEPCLLQRGEGYEVCEDEGAVQKGLRGGGCQWRPLNGEGVQQH